MRGILDAFEPKILFQDGLILLADKPAGIPVHETKDPHRPDFTRMLSDILGVDNLRCVNRLDLMTTGIVVFGLDAEKNLEIDELMKRTRKFYLAVVDGLLEEDDFKIESFLKDGRDRVKTVRSGGKKAITIFHVLGRDKKNHRTLVEAELVTGRRHQIRIHLSEKGYPIVGDITYGNIIEKRIRPKHSVGSKSASQKVRALPLVPEFQEKFNSYGTSSNAGIMYLHSWRIILPLENEKIIKCLPNWNLENYNILVNN